MLKKQVVLILTLIFIFVSTLQVTALTSAFTHSDSYKSGVYYERLLKVKLTGDGATDIANVAKSQVGYHEGNRLTDMDGSNATGSADYCEYNYNIHAGKNYPWCTSFVSWCAIQAGEGKAIPKTGSTGDIYEYVLNAGGTKINASDVRAGDIVFYKVTSTGSFCHMGIMTGATTSIEGNYSSAVKECKPATYIGTYGNTVANGKITVLYLRPAYSNSAPPQSQPVMLSVNTDKAEYTLGEAVTVTFSAENVSDFSLKITHNDKCVYEFKDNGDLTYKPTTSGAYTVTLSADNSKAECHFIVTEPEQTSGHFTDVSENAYYSQAVKWATENEVTNGTSRTTFSPDSICTRGQAVTFLWRASGCPMPQSTLVSFDDVAPDEYYFEAVAWAFELGITDGMGPTTFSPDAECTRAHIVTFIYRMHNALYESTETPFTDVAADAYYSSAVAWAVNEGITNGSSHTTFSPNDGCTRAQIVTFLYRDQK